MLLIVYLRGTMHCVTAFLGLGAFAVGNLPSFLLPIVTSRLALQGLVEIPCASVNLTAPRQLSLSGFG